MTRTWEIDTHPSVMPIDMVREQDFILRLRRLQRLGTNHLVVNLVLTAIPSVSKNHHVLDGVHKNLKEFAKITSGTDVEMSNGDIFLIWEETEDAELLVGRLVSVLPVESHQDRSSFLLTYHLPADYTKLRERSNHYIEVVRAAITMAAETPAGALKSDGAHGPLTAWSVDQIGKLLDDIDIRTYARTQPIYRLNDDNTWQQVSEEYFISFDDLRRERFPKLDMITPEHLFFALCEMVDQRLLTLLAKGHALAMAGRSLHINLSIASVIDKVFAQFTYSIPREKRGTITFELHRGDIFQDFSRTLSAIEILHKEGFKVAMDSVTPDMLPYINLGAFSLDRIKINVSGDRAALLKNDLILKSLQQLDVEKLIFFRCDSKQSLEQGRAMGIKFFQGWCIDDIVGLGKKRN